MTITPRMIEAGHPEATCERCGGRNIVWFALSEAWNEVTAAVGREVVWCPECFTAMAEEHGWHVTGFAAEVVKRERQPDYSVFYEWVIENAPRIVELCPYKFPRRST